MTESAIKSDINDQFPTPGIDNDSQVFRDNFSTIKTSLASAKTEIDQFLSHGVRNDLPVATMNGNILSSYVSKASSDFHYHITGLQVENFDLNYNNGLYQTVQIGSDLIIGLTNFPTDTTDNYKVGKVRLHLTADLVDRHVTFMTSSALMMYNDAFPFYESNKLTIRGSSTGIATIVDIWQVNNGTSTPIIYLEYVGLFQDTSKPIFQNAKVGASGTILTMAYNESLSSSTAGPNAFTVMVDGVSRPISAVTAASTTVTLTFTTAIEKGQLVTFSYTQPVSINAIKDSVGNKAISLSNITVDNLSIIDTTRPVYQSSEVSADGTTLRLLYNEVLNSTTAASTRFTVTVNGAPITVDNVAISESTVILSLGTTIQIDQLVTVGYTAPSSGDNAIKDTAGNKAIDLTNKTVINNSRKDTVSPVLQTAAVSANGTSFVLTYNETLNSTTAAKSDFVIGGTSAAISNVTAAASNVILTMSPAIQSGQSITLSYVRSDGPNAIKDLADNRVANFTLPSGNISITNSSTIDTIPPMVSSTAIDPTGLLLAITFNEPLKTTTAGTTAFAVTVAGNSRAVSTVASSGSTVTLTLSSAVQTGQTVTVSYTKPQTGNAIEDTTGNKTVDFTIASGSITNGSTVPVPPPADTTPPVFQSAAVGASGLNVALIYNEPLNTTTASPGDFTVTVAGSIVNISSVSVVAGNSYVGLILPVAIQTGQSVTVSYNAPLTGDNVIKDVAGNRAASIPTTNVTNNSTVTGGNGGNGGSDVSPPVFNLANVDATGLLLVILYNEAINSTTATISDFIVTAAGTQVTISSVAVVNGVLRLNLANPVQQGQIVKLTYNAPSGNNAIKDLAGNKAASIPETTITNDSLATGGNGNGGGGSNNPPATPTVAPTFHSSNPSYPYQPTLVIPTQLSDTVKLYVNNVYTPATYFVNSGQIVPDAPVGNTAGSYSFTYTLSNSYSESGKSPATAINLPPPPPNNPVTGSPRFEGFPYVGEQVIIAENTMADLDGLGPFSYQWFTYTVDPNDRFVVGTNSTYTIQAGDVGKNLGLTVSYTDLLGHQESVSVGTILILPGSKP